MTNLQTAARTPAALNLAAWRDPVVEALGHRPGSPYVELVWLGVLGPSTTLCWARLARIAAVEETSTVDVVDLATSLGLGEGLGRNAPVSRALGRMVAFGAARRDGDTLAVRLALGDVSERQAARLSASARRAHAGLAHVHRGRAR